MGKYFGTDGVRGVANLELTPELAFKLGRAGAYVLTKKNNTLPTIVLAKDTRLSSDMLEASLISGICSVGVNVISLGISPTPCVPFFIKHFNAQAGVVISASHNHFKDNGIKFFDQQGFKLNDDIELQIESLLDSQDLLPRPICQNLGRKLDKSKDLSLYIDFLASSIDTSLQGLNICIDCANGATYNSAPLLFQKLDANFSTINTSPNGININHNCGSTHMEELSKIIKNSSNTIGVAFDGDGDRCLFVDEDGNFIDGDQIMAICSYFFKKEGKLNSFVATVMSNLGLSIMAKQNNIEIFKANVGDRYVIEKMLEQGCIFGGEQSGHIIFLEHNTTGDGLLTAIKLLSIIKKSGKKLSELKNIIHVLPQVLVNAKVDNKKKNSYLQYKEIKDTINFLEKKLADEGRVLIRPSGTEPTIRVMLEGKNYQELKKDAQNLANLIEKFLN